MSENRNLQDKKYTLELNKPHTKSYIKKDK